MASDEVLEASVEHSKISTEQLEESQGGQQAVILMEAALEQGAGSDQENWSEGSNDDEAASDNGHHVKIGAEVALPGISYDFGKSGVTMACIASLESFAHYFLKGYGRAPGAETILDPHENEAVVFEDFFAVGLHIPPHPVLLDILRRFRVQLHQLTPNAIIQISKFIWVVASCRSHPTANVFTHHYELHYRNKKIHLEGSNTTFAVQFGCIPFHLSQFGNRAKLTPVTRNKWTSGWDGN
jgi:hypothetical protein